jgi:hypothetical protein
MIIAIEFADTLAYFGVSQFFGKLDNNVWEEANQTRNQFSFCLHVWSLGVLINFWKNNPY